MENDYIYYDNSEEVIEAVKKQIVCDDCKFCYTWKNDGRFYRCENEDSREVGIDLIPNPRVFGCTNFEKIKQDESED